MSETIEARVARGAAWLDQNEPGWERRVDLAKLELQDSCRCVLGQVFAEQAEQQTPGLDGYWWAERYYWIVSERSKAHGFVRDVEAGEEWSVLDEAWIELLKERFSNGTLSDEAVA